MTSAPDFEQTLLPSLHEGLCTPGDRCLGCTSTEVRWLTFSTALDVFAVATNDCLICFMQYVVNWSSRQSEGPNSGLNRTVVECPRRHTAAHSLSDMITEYEPGKKVRP